MRVLNLCLSLVLATLIPNYALEEKIKIVKLLKALLENEYSDFFVFK